MDAMSNNFFKTEPVTQRSHRKSQTLIVEEDEFLSAYRPPKGELQRLPIPNTTSLKNKQKKTSYIDEHIKYRKKLPGPAE